VDIYFTSIVFLLIVKLFISLLHLLYYSFIARVYVYLCIFMHAIIIM